MSTDTDTTAEKATEDYPSTLVGDLAYLIAKSRYEAWDSHSKTIRWEDYIEEDPATAHGIYLTDGLRDAEALMPMLRIVLTAHTAGGIVAAADHSPDPAFADTLRKVAARMLVQEVGA